MTLIYPTIAYMHELMPDVLEGRIEPAWCSIASRISTVCPMGYRAMNDREAIKVMIEF